MTNNKKQQLREKAQEILKQRGIDKGEFNKENLEKLIEELNIYQIELEHQNDELRKTQKELEKKNSGLNDLYHNAPVSYFTLDEDYYIVNVNTKGVELFNTKRNELLNSKFTDYIHPDFQDVFYHHHRKVLKEHKNDSCEIKSRNKSGVEHYIRLESIPTREIHTNTLALRTAIVDITLEKSIEEENFRRLSILKNISDSVIVTSLEGRITYWNRGAQNIFGYTSEEMYGKTPAVLYPDMDPEKLDYDLEKILQGKDYTGEWEGRTKKGETVWVNIRTSRLLDKNNELTGFLGVAKDVTKEKILTEKIRQEAERTKAYFELAGQMMLVLDKNGNIADINKRGCQSLGCKEKEFLGRNWVEHFIPDIFKEDNKKGIEKILTGEMKTPRYHEAFIKTKQGDEKLMAWNLTTLKDFSGNIIGLLASGEDITKKKQQDIYKSQLASIVEYSEEGMESMDIDGNILSWNKGAQNIYGYTPSEMIGKNAIKLYSEDTKDELKKILKTIKSGESVKHFETKRKRKDGKTIDVSITFSPLRNSKNQIISISVITRDITEQKQALREKARLASIVQSSHDAIISINSKKEVLVWNDAAEKLFGYKRDEILGKNVKSLMPETHEHEAKFIDQILKGEQVDTFDTIRRKKDGSLFDASISLSPILDADNQIIGVTAITKDITEKKDFERKLSQSEKRYKSLFESNKAIMLLIDSNTSKIVDANESALRFYKYTKEQLINKPIDEINTLPKDLVREEMDKAKRNKSNHFILKHKLATGEERDVEVYTSTIVVDNKKYLYSIIYDITQQEKNKKALKESELRYKTIFDESGSGILIMNKEQILSCNKKLVEMFGYSKDQIIGKSPVYFSPEKQYNDVPSKDLAVKYINEAFEKGSASFEWQHKNKKGEIVDTQINLKKVEINSYPYLIAILNDLTRIHKYQRKLQEQNEEILSQNEEFKYLNDELEDTNTRLRDLIEKLDFSEKKFKAAFKTSPDAVTINRIKDGMYVEINDGFTNLTDYTEKDVIGNTSADIDIWVNKKDRDTIVNGLNEKGYYQNLQAEFRKKDGSTLTGLMSANVIKINNEPCILALTRDISDRIAYENKIKEQEHYLRTIIQTNIDGFWIVDKNKKFIDVNDSYLNMSGYTREEFLELNINSIDAIEQSTETEKRIKEVIKKGSAVFETKHKRKDGSIFDVEISITYVDIQGGHFVCFCRDITEKKKAEKQIRELNLRNYLATSSAQIGIWEMDLERNSLVWDDNMYKLYGVKPDDFEGCYEAWQNGLHPDDRERAFKESEDAIHGKKEFHTNFRVLWPNKTVKHIEAHAQVIRDDEGNPLRMIGVNWDVTDKVLALEKIKKEEKRQRSVLKLMQTSVDDIQEFLDMSLSEAINITKSKVGYIYYFNEEKKQFILNSWSKNVMKDCSIIEPQTCYELDKTGIWGEAVRQRKTIIVNNFKDKNSLKKGYPDGHINLNNFMTVPVFQDNRIVAVVGVANKSSDYNELDELQLNLLMDAVWKTVETKKTQYELIESEKKYRRLAENISDVIWTTDLNFKNTYVSPSIKKLTGESIEAHLNKPIEKKIPKEHLQKIKKILKKELEKENMPGIEKNRSVLFETPFYKADGSTIWVTINVSFVRNSKGEIIGLQGVTHDITKRKQAEDELKLKSLVLDQVQDQVTITDLKGSIVYVNKTVLDKTGLSENELIGSSTAVYGEDTQKGASQNKILTQTLKNESWRGEVVNYSLEGTEIILDCRTQLVKNDEGKDIALCGISTDITEHKKVQQEIENLATMVDIAPNAILIHDFSGRILFTNKRNLKLHGYKEEEFYNLNLKDIDVPESAQLIKERMQEIDKKGEASFEVKHRRKDGTIFPLVIYVKKVNWKGIPAMLSIGTDITERKKAEQALRDSEEKYRLITENSTDVIWTMDLDLRYMYLSPSSEKVTGYKLNERNKIPDNRIFEEKSYRNIQKKLKKWINTYKDDPNDAPSFSFELEGKRKNNKKFFVEIVGGFLMEGDKVIGLQGSTRDITARKEMELELLEAKEKAEESDRLKSSFLANMSHEIRTPMNAIMGFSNLLKEKSFDKMKQDYFLSIINSRTKDLLRIIDDIIDISKIEANQLIIEKRDFELNQLLLKIYNEMEAELQNSGNKDLQFIINTDLLKDKLIINSDENRLKQVFTNLINNALKFTEKGSVEIGYTNQNNILEFFVKDTGIGIPEEHQKVIFQRFRQADDSTSRKYGGTGLGLSICKNIMNLLDGKIRLESKEGKGSTFYFSIPFIQSKKSTEEVNITEKPSLSYDWKEKTILIIEDDPLSMFYLTEILNDTRVKLIKSDTGRQGLSMLEKHSHIDLILLDISLPDINGNEIVQRIKKDKKDVPVIAQSAYSMIDQIKKSMKNGFDDYVTKPIDEKLLLSTINKYLNNNNS